MTNHHKHHQPPATSLYLLTSLGSCCGAGRLVYARLKLGLLDPPSSNPYTKIPPSAANSAENRELAARTAREGVVLLTNPKKTLPLVSNANAAGLD